MPPITSLVSSKRAVLITITSTGIPTSPSTSRKRTLSRRLGHPPRVVRTAPDTADPLSQQSGPGVDAALVEGLRVAVEDLGVQQQLAALAELLALRRPPAVRQGAVHRRRHQSQVAELVDARVSRLGRRDLVFSRVARREWPVFLPSLRHEVLQRQPLGHAQSLRLAGIE